MYISLLLNTVKCMEDRDLISDSSSTSLSTAYTDRSIIERKSITDIEAQFFQDIFDRDGIITNINDIINAFALMLNIEDSEREKFKEAIDYVVEKYDRYIIENKEGIIEFKRYIKTIKSYIEKIGKKLHDSYINRRVLNIEEKEALYDFKKFDYKRRMSYYIRMTGNAYDNYIANSN